MVTVFNPIASVMQAAYEQLDNRILRAGGDQLSLSRTGFWLRQSDEAGDQFDHPRRKASRPISSASTR